MANYQYIKEPNGKSALSIAGFENGIGDSPFAGIQYMSNLNVKTFPGAAYISTKRINSTYTGSAPSQVPTFIIQDPNYLTNLYSITSGGIIRQSLDSGQSWTIVGGTPGIGNRGQGLCIYQGYLLEFRDGFIDATQITITGSSGIWTTFYTYVNPSPTSCNNRMALTGIDNIVYSCNGNYILSIATTAGNTFTPGTPSTFIVSPQACTLPQSLTAGASGTSPVATWLCEQGVKLIIACGKSILSWDRTSTAPTTPVPCPDPICKVVNVDNFIYCFSGANPGTGVTNNIAFQGRGNIYVYNGFNFQLAKKMPDTIVSGFNTLNWTFGGVMAHDNKVFFGARASSGLVSGIYSLTPNLIDPTAGILTNEYSDPFLPLAGLGITTALCSINNYPAYGGSTMTAFVSGWTGEEVASTTYGYAINDPINTPAETATFLSDLISVGTNQNLTTYSQIELIFAQPLTNGENFNIRLIHQYNGSPVSITNGIVTSAGVEDLSYVYPMNVQDFQWIQIYLTLGSVFGGSRCILREIRLR